MYISLLNWHKHTGNFLRLFFICSSRFQAIPSLCGNEALLKSEGWVAKTLLTQWLAATDFRLIRDTFSPWYVYSVIPTNIKGKMLSLSLSGSNYPRTGLLFRGWTKLLSLWMFFSPAHHAGPASFRSTHLPPTSPVSPSTCGGRGRRKPAQPGRHPGYCWHSRHLEASALWRTSEALSQSCLAARGCIQRAA